jgi:hypothetical protein
MGDTCRCHLHCACDVQGRGQVQPVRHFQLAHEWIENLTRESCTDYEPNLYLKCVMAPEA